MNDNFDNNPFGTGYDPYNFSESKSDKKEDVLADAGIQEPVVQEPVVQEPVMQEPIVQEPIIQEPIKSEPAQTIPEWMKQPTTAYTSQENLDSASESSRSDSTYAYSFSRPEPERRTTPPPVTPPPVRPQAKPVPKKKKKSGLFTKILVCILLALIFGGVSGCVFVGVNAIGTKIFGLEAETSEVPQIPEVPKVESIGPEDGKDIPNKPNDESAEASAPVTGELTVAQVAERCMPAMVAITNTSIAEIPNYFGFGSQSYESTSSGSGIIIDQNDTELLIATNNHVISGANTLTVAFIDDALVEAIVKGTDVQNDLAVVSVKLTDIPTETLAQIRVIEIGDSDALSVGDQVVAIGNALGYGQSVSSGWVSALDREVTIDNTTLTLLQTDAAINPGNSGGALLNMRGELVAINESKYADTSVEGMGYAIPVSTATPILAELMSKTTRYKVDEAQASYLGISCKDISAEFAMMYNVPTGVYVDSVEENGPAALAGIKKGDIITKFDGTTLSSYTDLVGQLEYYAAGETVEVVVARAHMGDYQEEILTVTLGSRNDSEFLQQGIE